MTTLATVRAYWPAYDDVPDDIVELFIADAAAEIGGAIGVWGELYNRACAALAAHALEIRARSAAARGAPGSGGSGATAAGPLQSMTTGRLSYSFGNNSGGVASKPGASMQDAIYAGTPGGQEYLRLRGRLGMLSPFTH